MFNNSLSISHFFPKINTSSDKCYDIIQRIFIFRFITCFESHEGFWIGIVSLQFSHSSLFSGEQRSKLRTYTAVLKHVGVSFKYTIKSYLIKQI